MLFEHAVSGFRYYIAFYSHFPTCADIRVYADDKYGNSRFYGSCYYDVEDKKITSDFGGGPYLTKEARRYLDRLIEMKAFW
jgi:hypothetical protein